MTSYTDELLKLLALEYNCSPDDFRRSENVLTVPALLEGRRQYSPEKYFFSMVTLGGNAVVTADEQLHPFLTDLFGRVKGHWIFELHSLIEIEREISKYGFTLTQTNHMFLPCRHTEPKADFPVKWYTGEDIYRFYGDKRFPNAICPRFQPERPDRIVVCAFDGDDIIGMAGCSEDAPHWQQIGIDVMPEHRSQGVGKYLVTLLKNRIEELGDIPFYGTAVANYHSWNIAISCGFRPTWVEIEAKKIQ